MLPVRDHVARRTVDRAFRERHAAVEAWNRMCREFDEAAAPVFRKGQKLSGSEVDRLADGALDALAALRPLALLDHRREATRTRPKGEAREVLCVAPYASDEDGRRFIEIGAVRVALTRKRAVIESASCGVRFTEHAMRKALVRDVVEGEGIEGAFARQMLDHMGLVTMARGLAGRGLSDPADTLPLPFEEGLILGAFTVAPDTVFERLVYDGLGRRRAPFPVNPLLTPDHAGEARVGAELPIYKAQTVIGDDETTLAQSNLLGALRGFSARHRDTLNAVGEASLWGETLLRPVRRMPELRDGYEAAMADLARLMADPALNARRGGRPQAEEEEDASSAGAMMREAMMPEAVAA